MVWRKNIDPLLKEHLESLVKESYRHKKAYSSSKDPSKSQLWCAVASLSKELFDLHLKVKVIERALQDSLGKGRKKKVDDDVKKVMDSLSKF